MRLHVTLPGYEDLIVNLNEAGEISSYHLQGSATTVELFKTQLDQQGPKLALWTFGTEGFARPFERGCDQNGSEELRRSVILLRELVSRAKNDWKLPYEGEIVCQCRQVQSETIDHAVVACADDVETVASWTTACTSCTGCKNKIEEILQLRLPKTDAKVE